MTSRTSTKQKNNGIPFVSIVIILFSLTFFISQLLPHLNLFTEKFDAKTSTKQFNASQWRVPNSKHPISDSQLYAYAGYRYMQGDNPIFVNPEVPPLGKYIIGVSLITFQNEHIASLVFSFLAIVFVGYISWVLSKKSWKAVSFSILFMCTSSFIIDQAIHSPQLEIFQLVFMLLAVIFLGRYFQKKQLKEIVFFALCAGAFAATKIFLFSAALICSMLGAALFLHKAHIKDVLRACFILSVGIIGILLLSYTSYFFHDGNLRGFLGVQKWIYTFYRDSQIDTTKLLGSYIPLILVNKWKFWSTGYPYVSYDQWSLLWPLFFIGGILAALKLFLSKVKETTFVPLFAFFVVYSVSLLVIPIFPRYLTLLYPTLYIFVAVWFDRLLKSKNEKSH